MEKEGHALSLEENENAYNLKETDQAEPSP